MVVNSPSGTLFSISCQHLDRGLNYCTLNCCGRRKFCKTCDFITWGFVSIWNGTDIYIGGNYTLVTTVNAWRCPKTSIERVPSNWKRPASLWGHTWDGAEAERSTMQPRSGERAQQMFQIPVLPGLHCNSINDGQALEQNPFASGIICSTRYTWTTQVYTSLWSF